MSRAPYKVIVEFDNGKKEVRKKDTAKQASLEQRKAQRQKGVRRVTVEIDHSVGIKK